MGTLFRFGYKHESFHVELLIFKFLDHRPIFAVKVAPNAVDGIIGLRYKPVAFCTTQEKFLPIRMKHFSSGI